jgi:hypothetical protein
VKLLEGRQVRNNEFLYEIEESCPWCLMDIGAEALIAGTPRIHSDVIWMAEPRGIEITLYDHTCSPIAFHTHACESPWLP